MYHGYNGEKRTKRMNRTFEVISILADDPESSGRCYYDLDEAKEQLPHLASIIEADDFHSIKLVVGLNSLEVTVCSEEEDIEEDAWNAYQQEQDLTDLEASIEAGRQMVEDESRNPRYFGNAINPIQWNWW